MSTAKTTTAIKTFNVGIQLQMGDEAIETYNVKAYTRSEACSRYCSMFRPSHMWLVTCQDVSK